MVSDEELRPTLVLNPADDDHFRALAEGLVREGIDQPGALQDCLREAYPLVLVRRRELAGEFAHIWYVYRDGHWIRSTR
ncbi:MAG TPA: hypothetical protein VM427_01270 [Patescibacteria group bacterium]|nr:hypothetical protein [Patescibacteria group bacterium]